MNQDACDPTSQEEAERRTEYRLRLIETIHIELSSADPDQADGSAIVSCRTLDASANGLQVITQAPLTQGVILQLCIEFADRHERVYLAGEVKWCRQDQPGKYLVGFELFDSEGTDILTWKELMAEMFE